MLSPYRAIERKNLSILTVMKANYSDSITITRMKTEIMYMM
jgi:hypothetical protein